MFISFFPFSSEAVLWNKVVASFEGTVLTLWDVKREFYLQHIQRKGFLPTQDELRETTKTMIVEMLILQEAEGFNIGALAPSEIDKIFIQFKKKFRNQDEFQSFVATYLWTEDELRKVLMRPVRVERFIREKILSAYIFITDEEVEDYFREHKGIKKEGVKERLRKRRLYENLKDWIANLKNRSNIRTVWE